MSFVTVSFCNEMLEDPSRFGKDIFWRLGRHDSVREMSWFRRWMLARIQSSRDARYTEDK